MIKKSAVYNFAGILFEEYSLRNPGPMKKRTEYLILLLGIVIALLVVFSISSERRQSAGPFFSEIEQENHLLQ